MMMMVMIMMKVVKTNTLLSRNLWLLALSSISILKINNNIFSKNQENEALPTM